MFCGKVWTSLEDDWLSYFMKLLGFIFVFLNTWLCVYLSVSFLLLEQAPSEISLFWSLVTDFFLRAIALAILQRVWKERELCSAGCMSLFRWIEKILERPAPTDAVKREAHCTKNISKSNVHIWRRWGTLVILPAARVLPWDMDDLSV